VDLASRNTTKGFKYSGGPKSRKTSFAIITSQGSEKAEEKIVTWAKLGCPDELYWDNLGKGG
jgi:hypothetical protein